ncbi:hypothetical protein GCM10009541_25250 [Micromonospora gifhornensis]|uniref:SalK n=2 Tax=Micromonospora gifhornensis TaxID=84594 RepID=A0ABQ4IHP0_9ACTN|nr:hypothetical protein Vgi01_41030 [Micromonospora gifhornensis]
MTAWDDPAQAARLMWTCFEPVHAVTYFHPRARAAYEAVGLRGYWRGYFAGRAAPLGPVGPAPVVAAFYTFAPHMVARALPSIWQLADPEQALRARLTGAVQALAELTYELPERHLAEAAELLEAAAEGVGTAPGRVLGAANAALPRGDYPLARLWQAATTLREHRGDGHVAALVAADLDPVEALAWRVADGMAAQSLQGRGWSDHEWAQAQSRLTTRGWLTPTDPSTTPTALPSATPTVEGRAAFQAIETATDSAAARPWHSLTPDTLTRLHTLLLPIAQAAHQVIPSTNPIGLPTPQQG